MKDMTYEEWVCYMTDGFVIRTFPPMKTDEQFLKLIEQWETEMEKMPPIPWQ